MAGLHFINTVNRLFIETYRTVNLKFVRHKNIGKITDIKIETAKVSHFLQPVRMTYKENGKAKKRDLIKMRHYVYTLTYNISRNVVILVKRFSPGQYFINVPTDQRNKTVDMHKYNEKLGIVVELCGGMSASRDRPVFQTAKRELLKECGYDVPLEKFEEIHHYNLNVGVTGSTASLCYCEVTDAMKVGDGITNVSIVEMDLERFDRYIDKRVSNSVVISYYWFRYHKHRQKK